MGVFHFFKIVLMVSNHTKHHKQITPSPSHQEKNHHLSIPSLIYVILLFPFYYLLSVFNYEDDTN